MTSELTRHWDVRMPLTADRRRGLGGALDARFADDPGRIPALSLAYDIEVLITPTDSGFTITASRLASDEEELPATKWSWVEQRVQSAVLSELGILVQPA